MERISGTKISEYFLKIVENSTSATLLLETLGFFFLNNKFFKKLTPLCLVIFPLNSSFAKPNFKNFLVNLVNKLFHINLLDFLPIVLMLLQIV